MDEFREHTEQYYIPAALAYRERAAEEGATGGQVVSWQRTLKRNWSNLRFGEVKVRSDAEKHSFEVQVYLGGIAPDMVRVELYADGLKGDEPVRLEMTRGQQLVGANGYIYSAQVPSARPASAYTARVMPHRPGVSVPLEATPHPMAEVI